MNESIDIGIPQRLAHLPLVLDVLRRSGVLDVIDHAVRDDRRSKVSTSECVAVILCGVFVGHHDLWRMADRLSPYDMKTIMRDPGFELREFPEERLAKALDDLYHANLDKLMTAMAIQAIKQFRLGTDFLHFDTTSLSFFGAYEREDMFSMSDGLASGGPAPLVTFGYSKDNRGDLKQILFGSLVTRDGGVPLYGKALDGNRSDSECAAEFFQRVRSLVQDPKTVCCVADSKGWCAPVLEVIRTERLRLLSRLPRNYQLHDQIMAMDGPVRRIERPPKKKGQDPECYEIAGFDVDQTFEIRRPNGEGARATIEHMVVPARAVRIFSGALLRKKMKTLERVRRREAVDAKRLMREWQARAYACERDARRAIERQTNAERFVTLDITATVEAVDGPIQRGRGRPRKRPEPEIEGRHFRVRYNAVTVTDSVSEERLRDQATFVLIRTRSPGWTIDDADLIDRYKGQFHNEHGFAWLKSGPSHKGLNPIFLETPTRIASLCFLYVIGLMVWSLIQRTVRKNLSAMGEGLPYHRNKPSAAITTRFLFELFPKVQTVPFRIGDGQWQKKLVGVDDVVKLACRALGTPIGNFQPVGK